MKRCILFICLLISCCLSAQNVYTYQYWFDDKYETHVTDTFNDSIMQADLDVGNLADGLHFLNIHVKDTSNVWSAPQSFMFIKMAEMVYDSTGMVSNLQYHCWFDQDYSSKQSGALGNGHIMLDVTELSDGMHTVNVMLKNGKTYTAAQSYMFIKVAEIQQDTVGMGTDLQYHCWFDQDYSAKQSGALGNGHIMLNVSELSDGMHTVNVMLEGNMYSVPMSYMFIKVAPLVGTEPLQYQCWFDRDYSTLQTGMLGEGLINLDVSALSDGLHTVNVQLYNGTYTTPNCYMFYKIPVGGTKIKRWEYFLNGDYENRERIDMDPALADLSIMTLLPVEIQPIRSMCFEYDANDGEPVIYAKNEISFRFWATDDRFIDRTHFYVDENVKQEVVADEFAQNTSELIMKPGENEIRWFKVMAQVGDSLTFKADKACSLQLFSPSGEEVYNVSGQESMRYGGRHAWEDGYYYLAVHDVMGSGSTVNVSYQFIHKYAVLAWDAKNIGNGGVSTVTVQGNGFNSLVDAYLVDSNNDTIKSIFIGHEKNTTTTLSFDFLDKPLGKYELIADFYNEIIRVNNFLTVEEPKEIELDTDVSYASSFLRGTTTTYTYNITNKGNMSAYSIPLYLYLSTPYEDGISRVDIEGLGLKSIISEMDLDSLSANDLELYRNWADEVADTYYFITLNSVDEETGEPVVVKSNYFFVNFAPNETKTIKVHINLKDGYSEAVDVWMSTPEIITPLTLNNTRGFKDHYCCVKDKYSCVMDIVCGVLNLADMVTSCFPGTTASIAVGIANCVCNILSTTNSKMSAILCEEDGDVEDFLHKTMNINSWVAPITSCLTTFLPSGKLKNINDFIGRLSSTITASSGGVAIFDCVKEFSEKKPNCPPQDPPQGGSSTPVNSLDPNDIYGYTAESGSKFMRQDIQKINYEIEFENDTTLANAAAHTIVVTDTLDANRFDLASFSAHGVTIGEKILHLNGEQNFVYTLDLRPEINVIAQIEQEYDAETGIIKWTISSLDPMTMEPSTDPDQGALPVNYYGDGIGTLNYSVRLKDYFDDGTEISNRACIVFDLEAAIVTPTWTNIVDAVNPTSQIEEVIPFADSLKFVFNSEDMRSGVWYHTLYHRNDSTNMEWDVLKTRIFEDTYTMKLESLQNSEYLVMATDSAGNNETKAFESEYVFTLDSLNYYELVAYTTNEDCKVLGSGTYVENSDIEIEAVPSEAYHFVQWNDFVNDNPRTVHLTQDTTIMAQFAINQYEVTLAVQDSLMGTVSGAGIYEHDQIVNVVADENKGYVFLYWLESDSIASTELEYSFNIKCDRNLTAVFGPADAHYTMLKKGWNWYSTYIDVRRESGYEKLTDGLNTNGVIIKSQTKFATYYEDYDIWDGSLTEVDNKNMYMIDMSAEHYLMMDGSISYVSQTEMTLKPGWNWISYPIDKSQTLARSLKDFKAKDGDYIKSQTGYATYYEGYGWDGSLLTLDPGQGYMYKNNDTIEKTLTYSKSYVRKTKVNNITTDGNHWQADVNKYPNNMNITAVLSIDGVEQKSDNIEIGVFADGECRGSARAVYKEVVDRYIFFLTVYGEGNETLTFRMYDTDLNYEYPQSAETFTFSMNAIMGDMNNPYIIDYSTVDVEENEQPVMTDNIYPNPVNKKETIYLNKNYEKIEVINSLGMIVKSYENTDRIKGIRESGIYIVKTFEGKTIVYNKLIVK